jgi:hypothetical protein
VATATAPFRVRRLGKREALQPEERWIISGSSLLFTVVVLLIVLVFVAATVYTRR